MYLPRLRDQASSGTLAGEPTAHCLTIGCCGGDSAPRNLIEPTSFSGFGSITTGVNPSPVYS